MKISVSSAEGRSAILNLIGAEAVRSARLRCFPGRGGRPTPSQIPIAQSSVIDRRDLLPFVRSQPALAMKFIELFCARLRRTSEQVEQIILLDLPGRIASALLGLTAERKLDPESRMIAITQQEISEMVGMTRESINKQLGVWAARNWVRLEHGAIVVLDANSLRKLAETGSGSDE